MNLALRKPMTLAEFLEWEERQPLRYEFDGVFPVAMTGGTAGHADVQRNLAIAVGGRLRGKPCRFYGSDLKFQVAESHVATRGRTKSWSPTPFSPCLRSEFRCRSPSSTRGLSSNPSSNADQPSAAESAR